MSRGKDGLRLKSLKYMLELTSRCNLRCGMCPMDVLTRPFEDACGVKVNATYMGSSDDLVAKLRAGGAETIQEYLDSGLIDEFSITLAPVLFGTGIRLFDRVDPARLALDQARTDASPRVTHLTYTAVKR